MHIAYNMMLLTFKHLYLYSRLGPLPWDDHPPRESRTEFAALHRFGRPRPGRLGEGAVIPFGPVAFLPQWVYIECGIRNQLGDPALTLHTRNGERPLYPLFGRPLSGSLVGTEWVGLVKSTSGRMVWYPLTFFSVGHLFQGLTH